MHRGNFICMFEPPWFKYANEVTSAATSGSHLGPQVGLQPNELNNKNHDEDETPMTDGEIPGASVFFRHFF